MKQDTQRKETIAPEILKLLEATPAQASYMVVARIMQELTKQA